MLGRQIEESGRRESGESAKLPGIEGMKGKGCSRSRSRGWGGVGEGWGREAWQAYILLHLFFLEPHLPPPPPLEKSFYRDGSSAGLLLAYCRFSLVSCPILIKVQKCSFGQLPIPWQGPSGGGWQFNLNQSVSLLNFLYFCNSMTHTSLESRDAVWVAFVSFISLVIIWGKSWNL